jgi:hypothetical protein
MAPAGAAEASAGGVAAGAASAAGAALSVEADLSAGLLQAATDRAATAAPATRTFRRRSVVMIIVP